MTTKLGHSAIDPIVPFMRNERRYYAAWAVDNNDKDVGWAADVEHARIYGYRLALEACVGAETAATILREAWKRSLEEDALVCARCGESFDDAGDGYCDLCPTCADAHEDAFERGLALAHDGISEEDAD